MEDKVLQKYRASWKSEQSFERRMLSEAEIQGFMKKKSGEISRSFRKGLIFDMVLKSVIGVSFLVLAALFFNSAKVVAASSFLLAGIVAGIVYQAWMLRKIPPADYARDNLKKVLEVKISFYRKKYLHSLFVGASSNAFLIISGMLFYFYFKYGEVRPLGTDDYIVFGTVIMISFVLAAFLQIKQHNFHIRQLEVCLHDIDEHNLHELTLRSQRNKRRNLFLVYLLAFIFGLLIFLFLLSRST